MRMPVLDVGLPESVSIHKSGGRDQWSEPMVVPPLDRDAALLECLTEVLDPEIEPGPVTVAGRRSGAGVAASPEIEPASGWRATGRAPRPAVMAEPGTRRVSPLP